MRASGAGSVWLRCCVRRRQKRDGLWGVGSALSRPVEGQGWEGAGCCGPVEGMAAGGVGCDVVRACGGLAEVGVGTVGAGAWWHWFRVWVCL